MSSEPMPDGLRTRAEEIVKKLLQEVKLNTVAGGEERKELAAPWRYLLTLAQREEVEPCGHVEGDDVTGERYGALYGDGDGKPVFEIGQKLYTSPPASRDEMEQRIWKYLTHVRGFGGTNSQLMAERIADAILQGDEPHTGGGR